MAIVSGGVGLASTSGTTLAVDTFGDLTVTGQGANTGQVEVLAAGNSNTATLDSGAGLNVASDSGRVLLQNHDGSVKTLLGLQGVKVSLFLTAAPGTGNLSAGEMALWFDQTNGASKLMVQAKSANGTLVAGSLALA